MKILILGGNGFIGNEIARAAYLAQHDVTCIGRNIKSAQTRLPKIKWISQDIAKLTNASQWHSLIKSFDAIINCAGSLQQSPHDHVVNVQEKSMLALYEAASSEPDIHIVQISANTMSGTLAGETSFLKTKMNANTALTSSGINHTILRPALVIGRNAYGGTALLRSIAAFPYIVPLSFANSMCQVTSVDELALISLKAANGEYGLKGDYSIGSKEQTSLKVLTLHLRSWLGFKKAKVLDVPKWIAHYTSKLADISGILGWRSPMRSTAMKVLQDGILLEPSKPLIETGGIDHILSAYTASVQDKWFARLYLLKPLFIIILSMFWLTSGIIALFNVETALDYLSPINIDQSIGKFLIIFTAIADCILGLGVLFRKYSHLALIGMCLLSLGYLASATLFIPGLWLDPIGPLVKVIPTIFLALATLILLDER